MRTRVATLAVAVALLASAWWLVNLRHDWIRAVTTFDAEPSPPPQLPAGAGAGLARVARTRVVLIDGLAADTARTLPAWSALCARGDRLVVDVGFPSVSLPVEVALWSGLTQQQSGIVGHGDRAIAPPIHGIPGQIAGSRAIAEDHGYIIQSLGFSSVDSEGDWQARAVAAIASSSPLVFVHVLRVDTAGHRHGADSDEYRAAAREADAILGTLVWAAPDARWFALSDHGHLPGGGHGGEERAVRQVAACIAGFGVAPGGSGGPIHITDVARALADSTGTHLAPGSPGRPLGAALAAPLAGDQALPTLPLRGGAIALFVIALGLVASSAGVKRWWLAPWWLIAACGALVLIRGEPTLSTPMIYAHEGRAMYVCWLAALPIAGVTAWRGGLRAVIGQLALPVALVAAAISASGGWATVIGDDVAPVVPRYTAWVSPLVLVTAHGAAAVALGLLATLVRPASGRRAPRETPRSAPAAA